MADYPQSDREGNKYPPGWDCKYDSNTGKCYYINYLTKAMSLEDPRIKYKQLQNERMSNESIQMQPVHGSPYHVYPTSSYPVVQAFQTPIGFNNVNYNNNNSSMTSSPLLMAKIQQQMEMSQVIRNGGSPQSTRMMMHQQQPQPQHQQHQFSTTSTTTSINKHNIQETSFITPAETDAAVAKINLMFPTASDSHIRLLLKKYYNREAVVISALQVEKHPLTTPGPFSTPPPPIRHNSTTTTIGINSAYAMTPPLGGGGGGRFEQISRTGSPIPPRPASANASTGSYYGGSPRTIGGGGGDQHAYRQSPKPHSSPKMKLRYLKSIFPKAEETLLLDILANAENNVQRASEQLQSMGYEKRDTTAPRLTNRQREAECMRAQREAENTPPPQPKLKTLEDKKQIKTQLQTLYKDVPGRIITMALESVDYSEERAIQILQIVMHQDENDGNKIGSNGVNNKATGNNNPTSNGIPPSKSSQSIKSAAKKLLSSQPQPQTSSPSSSSSLITSKTAQPQPQPPQSSSHPSNQNLAQGASSSKSSSDVKSPNTLKLLLDSCSTFASSSSNHHHDHDENKFVGDADNKKTKCSTILISRKSNRNRLKTKKTENLKASSTATDEIDSNSTTSTSTSTSTSTTSSSSSSSNNMSEFKSVFDRIQTTGANPEVFNGPNEEILLADYIAWNGANPDLCCGGQKGLAIGPDKSLRKNGAGRGAAANSSVGSNKELYKGPKVGLAKGSIYSQIKCN